MTVSASAKTFVATEIPFSNVGLPFGAKAWDLPAGWEFENGTGPSGGSALRLTRTDPQEYVNARLPFRLPPETRCRFEASIRVEEATEGRITAMGAVEFFDAQNRYLGGGHLGGVNVMGEWVKVEAEFTVTRDTDECRLMFYIKPGAAGTVRFANPVIGPAPFRWTAYPLTPVRDELPAEGGPVTFAYFSQGLLMGQLEQGRRCRVELEREGGGSVASGESLIDEEGRFTLTFGRLAPGTTRLRYTLLGSDGAELGTKSTLVTVVDEEVVRGRIQTGCVVDRQGRMMVRGQKYFPLALYMGYVQLDELKDIQDSAFNCLIPYGSCGMTLTGSSKKDVEGAREVLDACEAHNIKVVFSFSGAYDEPGADPCEGLGVKTGPEVSRTAVKAFKDHPAILAWYLNDEQPIENLPRLLERRRLVRELDPLHPIYAVMCQIPEFPFYSELVDIYGIDPYPIVDPAMNHIRLSQYAHQMAERAVRSADGIPLWTVIQAHNIGAYDQKACKDPEYYRENFRDPTFEEMLALTLVALIHGAKGLIFFSYPDLAHPDFDAGAREQRWTNTKRVAQAVKDVEGYLMSDADSPAVELDVQEGAVEARSFQNDDGRWCVILAGIGPGPCRATFKAPAPKMTSMFGRTRLEGQGVYCFKGTDVVADILVESV